MHGMTCLVFILLDALHADFGDSLVMFHSLESKFTVSWGGGSYFLTLDSQFVPYQMSYQDGRGLPLGHTSVSLVCIASVCRCYTGVPTWRLE